MRTNVLARREPLSLRLAAVVVALALGLFGGVAAPILTGSERPAYAAATRAGIAETANRQVGYQAPGSQCQPYGPLCDDWCAMFATWVWEKSGVAGAPRSTYVATGIGQWGVSKGLFKRRPAGQRGNPLPGDIVVYGEPGSGVGGHVSVVYSVNRDGTITTIDGNYSNAVKKRTINPATARAGGRNVLISGYVAPPGVTDTPPPPPKPTGTVGDFSGDGFSDVLGADAKGNLFYYPNNSNASGKFKPALGIRAAIDHGWSSYPHVMSADFSGDRHADVLAVDVKGNLFYYPNNSRAGGKWNPALGKRAQLGHGWSTMKFVQAADFSGHGHADLIAVDAKGTMFYYPNNSKATGTWKPALGKPIVIGHGWNTMKFVQAADFSGDKYADIIAVDAKGGMFYYPNNSNASGKFKPTLGKRAQIGHGWNTMKHLQAADFSGDKHADIVAIDAKGGLFYYPNSSRVTGKWQPALGKRAQIGHGWNTFQAIA
ncbi:FG-GAP-like repeat-containing protein [Microlunatus sp. GCM10028923]|uniref:FG-GAP-like repeat-containing protein n=1 Tax=Microlunatus sp. GCM10028923 TaxID=3273400 RepID=UPI00360E990C